MSNATLHKTEERLQEAGIEAAWASGAASGQVLFKTDNRGA